MTVDSRNAVVFGITFLPQDPLLSGSRNAQEAIHVRWPGPQVKKCGMLLQIVLSVQGLKERHVTMSAPSGW